MSTEPQTQAPDEANGGIEPGSATWWDAHQQRLGRRRPRMGGLTVERIVDEALELTDREGLDALTVRVLAGRLGTSSATLYRHVASVDELLVLMIDRVLGEVRPPADDLEGRERLVIHACRFRDVLLAHPGVVPALRVATPLGPNAMRAAAAGLDSLLTLGFPASLAVVAYLSLIDYVLGSVFFDSVAASGVRSQQIDETTAPVFADNQEHFLATSSDAVFQFGVGAFVDGLMLRLGEHGRSEQPDT